LFAAGTAAAALSRSVPLLFLIQGVLGLAHGVGYPTLMGLSIRDVALDSRTTAMGIHQSVYAAGIFLGPWVSGMLADALGLRPMFGLNAVICLVLGAAGTLLLSRSAQRRPERISTNSR
jgi:MFS family permease